MEELEGRIDCVLRSSLFLLIASVTTIIIPILRKYIYKWNIAKTEKDIRSRPRVKLCKSKVEARLLNAAVHDLRFDIVEWLLARQQIYVKIPHSNKMYAVLSGCNVEYVKRLVHLEYSLVMYNATRKTSEHYAAQTSPEFLTWFIQHGANINGQDSEGNSPLHLAVEADNLESVSILLDNKVDTGIRNCHGRTAFMTSLIGRQKSLIQEKLLNLEYNIKIVDNDRKDALNYAAEENNPIVHQIMLRACYLYGLRKKNVKKKVIIPYLKLSSTDMALHDLFMKEEPLRYAPFLIEFIASEKYERMKWLQYLHIFVHSEFTAKLIEDAAIMCENGLGTYQLFYLLITTFFEKSVEKEDRIAILKSVLKFPYRLTLAEARYVHKIYDFEEELELFINYPIYFKKGYTDHLTYDIMSTFIFDFNLFATNSVKLTLNHFCKNVLCASKCPVGHILLVAPFFALKTYLVDWKIRKSDYCTADFAELIHQLPTVPTLMELSRNKTIAAIALKFVGESPTFYHNYIKQLRIPLFVRDVLRLKTPIYYDVVASNLYILHHKTKIWQ